MKRSAGPRKAINLSRSVHHRLNSYALAASAASLSMLGSVSPAEAKVVYTPAHIKLTSGHSVLVDLNHDGFNDFNVSNFYSGITHISLVAAFPYVRENSMLKGPRGCGKNQPGPAALKTGARIGKAQKFAASATCLAVVPGHSTTGAVVGSYGSWKGVNNRYLGVQFQIKGKMHFGWIRLSVSRAPFVVTMTGYAYETVPNRAIIAGKTKGPEPQLVRAALSQHHATLGALAMGAPGLSIWRRKELTLQAN